MIQQRTLKTSVPIIGIGVHSGQSIELHINPAPINSGIIFRRTDLHPTVEIPAHIDCIGDTRLNTSLTKDGVTIATIEHLLSAFAGLGIDNAYVDINGAELPVMDGSSKPFVVLLKDKLIEQPAAKQFLCIKKPITVTEGDKRVGVEPYEGFKFSLTIDFPHPIIRNSQQNLTIDFANTSYIDEISGARTFGFLSEYDYLRKNNLALGASLENTVVLDEHKVLNAEGLRYADEFVKHKMLDALGDLYLLGHTVIGAFTGYKSGHALNHKLRQALLADKTAWELVSRQINESLPVSFNSTV